MFRNHILPALIGIALAALAVWALPAGVFGGGQ